MDKLNDYVEKLLDKGITTEQELIDNKDLVKLIADESRKTEIFKINIDKYYEFIEETKNESAFDIFCETLEKIIHTPFLVNMIIALRMPVIDYLLNNKEQINE